MARSSISGIKDLQSRLSKAKVNNLEAVTKQLSEKAPALKAIKKKDKTPVKALDVQQQLYSTQAPEVKKKTKSTVPIMNNLISIDLEEINAAQDEQMR